MSGIAKGAIQLQPSQNVTVPNGGVFNLGDLDVDETVDSLYLGFRVTTAGGGTVTFEATTATTSFGSIPFSDADPTTRWIRGVFRRDQLGLYQLRGLSPGNQSVDLHILAIRGDYQLAFPQKDALISPLEAQLGHPPQPLSSAFYVDAQTTVVAQLRNGSIERPYATMTEAITARGTGFFPANPVTLYLLGTFAAEAIAVPAGGALALAGIGFVDLTAVSFSVDTAAAGPTSFLVDSLVGDINVIPMVNDITLTGDGTAFLGLSKLNAPTMNVDSSGALVGHAVNLQMVGGRIGAVIPPGGVGSPGVATLISLVNQVFDGSVDTLQIGRAQNCRFAGDVRVGSAPPTDPTGFGQQAGIFQSELAGAVFETYGGGGVTYNVDSVTASNIAANGVSLGAGPTLVTLNTL